jgi:hypothetical protein
MFNLAAFASQGVLQTSLLFVAGLLIRGLTSGLYLILYQKGVSGAMAGAAQPPTSILR